jgi:ribonucleotide reductase alpha subunit
MDSGLKLLSEVVTYDKYYRYLPEQLRRENWRELVGRNESMNLEKTADAISAHPDAARHQADLAKAYDHVRDHAVLPSMRSMQFAGDAIRKSPNSLYNCAFLSLKDTRAFREILFLSIKGSGVGFSVQNRHISQLPVLQGPRLDEDGKIIEQRFMIQDDAIGWCQALDELIQSYYYGKRRPVFNYSDIRKKGTPLKTSGGLAPGPDGLRKALERVELILKAAVGRKLMDIEAYDIIMHLADCVVSGGIRRSATICIFDKSSIPMLMAKSQWAFTELSYTKLPKGGLWKIEYDDCTGSKKIATVVLEDQSWSSAEGQRQYALSTGKVFSDLIEPQRARSNNSVVLHRPTTTRAEFEWVYDFCRRSGRGEPGFVWLDDLDFGVNPCLTADATLLTPNGLTTMGEIQVGDKIWSTEGWTTVTAKWSNGIKDTFRYNTTQGHFLGTADHKVLSSGIKTPVDEVEAIDLVVGPTRMRNVEHDRNWVMAGLLLGDGTVHKTSKNKIALFIGQDDESYFASEVAPLIGRIHPAYADKGGYQVICPEITAEHLPHTYDRCLGQFLGLETNKLRSLLRGLFSANGSVVRNRITLKATSFQMISDVQVALSSLGIPSYYTTNKPSTITHANGEYTSRESYDLNVTVGRAEFARQIGFIQDYKNQKIDVTTVGHGNKQAQVVSREDLGLQEVWDITVDNSTHTFWTGGLNVSNCVEIALRDMQFCNLCEINAESIKSYDHFMEIVKAATIIGTIQASWTDFHYLRPEWEKNCKEEALLGLGITGIAGNKIDPAWLRKGAEYAIEVNREWAAVLGIKPAARLTCVKPAGSTSCVLGCSSGIHAWYDKFFIRTVRLENVTPLCQYLLANAPHMCEPEKDSPLTKTVLSIPCRAPEGATTRADETLATFIDRVMLYQREWVTPGHVSGPHHHNVSATIFVKDDEWDYLCDRLWNERNDYAGLSVLPYSGGNYDQAPFQSISEERYHELLAAVPTDLDLTKIIESTDTTTRQQEAACAGGSCER